ncbi:Reelin [Channa argus]|uniref:Reelin n=1 Tax=Channa argus TaxID=215402 RepID=A0A6G1PEE0_CHAAH|nr:Reelin [Channa argus]
MAMVLASLGGALGCVLLVLVVGSSSMDFGAPPANLYPRFNPFFFLCTHHGELEGVGVAEGGGEVLLTLQITGNPTAYTPGQEYQGLTVRSLQLNERPHSASANELTEHQRQKKKEMLSLIELKISKSVNHTRSLQMIMVTKVLPFGGRYGNKFDKTFVCLHTYLDSGG